MMLSETLPDMDKHISLRQLAGSIVRDEIARQRFNRKSAAERAKMAPSTLARAINGEPDVKDLTLRQIEGAFGLPRHLLTAVIEGNEKMIGETDMDEDLRRYVLSSVIDIKNDSRRDEKPPKRGRRV